MWDASTDADVGTYKYRVHYGSKPFGSTVDGWTAIQDVEPGVLTAVIKDLPRGKTYYFNLTALNSEGVESLPSNEIRYGVPVRPTTPYNLRTTFPPR